MHMRSMRSAMNDIRSIPRFNYIKRSVARMTRANRNDPEVCPRSLEVNRHFSLPRQPTHFPLDTPPRPATQGSIAFTPIIQAKIIRKLIYSITLLIKSSTHSLIYFFRIVYVTIGATFFE
ncbi:hypothetical protein BVI1335_1520053 [Burkholderia vietnamiensis]|nr:hypothetical protein BVI1335_1520053 [Burkholderia vietnamiensis]